MCLFIIGPGVNGLKGVTTHHRKESVTAFWSPWGKGPAGWSWSTYCVLGGVLRKTWRGSEREGLL